MSYCRFSRVGLVMVSICLVMMACGRSTRPEALESKIQVVASILPLADFTRQVGGERVNVEVLVPAGASPHTYELTPAQLRAVSHAKVLVLNGAGLEFWANKVISSANNPNLVVVTLSDGLKIIAGDRDEPGGNPHTWLSPINALKEVERICDVLIQVDPDGSAAYRANTEKYLSELRGLDADIRAAVSGFSSREFIAFHAAWTYFANDYGLEEVDVIEQRPGQEPSPAEISEIVRKAKGIKARAILAEPQFSSKAAEAVAEECGARVLLLNPLGEPPGYHYIDLMRFNLGQLSVALH